MTKLVTADTSTSTLESGTVVQVQAMLARGLMSRCFFEWRRLADDRWWKKQLLFREREIELLEKLCGGFRNRPLVVMRKRRLSRCLATWLQQTVRLRRKRLRLNRAVKAFLNRQMHAAWSTWVDYTNVRCPHVCSWPWVNQI